MWSVVLFTEVSGQNYINYYHQINAARLKAVNGQLLTAARIYHRTFETYDFEFARDCINAVETACAAKHDSLTSYFIECGLRRGIPIEYFAKKKALDVFRKTPDWNKLKERAHRLRTEYLNSLNEALRAEINTMFSEDQAIRTKYYKGWNIFFRPMIRRRWQALNQVQVARIIEITQKIGFPGEQLIGIDESAYHEKIVGNEFSAGMPIVILVHHYSHPNPSFDSVFFKQVAPGNLNNEHFATICDFQAEFGKGAYPNMGSYGLQFLSKKVDPSDFDEKRRVIGLPTHNEIEILNQSFLFTKFWNRLR